MLAANWQPIFAPGGRRKGDPPGAARDRADRVGDRGSNLIDDEKDRAKRLRIATYRTACVNAPRASRRLIRGRVRDPGAAFELS